MIERVLSLACLVMSVFTVVQVFLGIPLSPFSIGIGVGAAWLALSHTIWMDQ